MATPKRIVTTPSPASTLHRKPANERTVDFLQRMTDEACRANYAERTPQNLRRYYEWRELYQQALRDISEAIS